ncbi:MAG TPA: uroporphyrinogen decarboxylase [Melioribacteraceae bacterium]|nr:uroporphyrinogen decarboxylase [Melioribacteraceae bacterium]
MTKIKNDLIIKALKREKVERTPIWAMRQAGRYLPEYRNIRAKSDFLTMCKTPELAAEVTIQPVDIIGVDAAILFSDILVIPEAMGMHLIMNEGKGPVFPNPIKNLDDINKLKMINSEVELKYVMDAINLVKKGLDNRVPLLGFSGSPFTLLTYMVEGSGSKTFSKVKSFIYNNPKEAHILLNKLSTIIADYLSVKIANGVNAVQIFDTWGGILSPSDFDEFSLHYIQKIVSEIKRKDEPIILFAKGVHHSLLKMANIGINALGLDWTMNLGEVRKTVGNKVALQGNLDPTVLYGTKDLIKVKALEVLKEFGEGEGHVFNLGHGILPDVNPMNLKYLVDVVKVESEVFHKKFK